LRNILDKFKKYEQDIVVEIYKLVDLGLEQTWTLESTTNTKACVFPLGGEEYKSVLSGTSILSGTSLKLYTTYDVPKIKNDLKSFIKINGIKYNIIIKKNFEPHDGLKTYICEVVE